MNRILPSLIAKNQKEFDKNFEKVKKYSKNFHLDVMDGKFVKNKSMWFDFKLPRGKRFYAHLMIENPEKWIKKNLSKVDGVYVHYETVKDIRVIAEIVSPTKKLGIVLNPSTGASKIKDNIDDVDVIIVMSVIPGKYGAKFLPSVLAKIRKIRKMSHKIIIGVDGSVNEKTLGKLKKAGADFFVVGSYVQNSEDVGEAMRKLRKL
jgi:ribulose-phosphate 3-epimerase